jgi:16S rRNA (guanine527-N7)-methyltransferase
LNVSLLREGAAALGLELDDSAIAVLERYAQMVERDRASFGLTGIRESDEFLQRQVLESLSLVPLIRRYAPPSPRLIDVGSGGGIPGIPIAIAAPDFQVVLLEARARKAGWLESAASELGVKVEVVAQRAEDAARRAELREAFDVCVAKAVAPLRQLLELTIPFLRSGAYLLALKGERLEQELEEAVAALSALAAEVVGVQETAGTRVIVVRKLESTPARFPRRPAAIAKRPL